MLIPIHGQSVLVTRAGVVDLDFSMLAMAALFLTFFFLYHKVFVGKLVDMFDRRHDLTTGSRVAAEHAVKNAEVKIAEYQSRIGEVRRKAVDETKRIRHEGEKGERETIEAARAAAAAQTEQGLKDLAATASKAHADLAGVAQAAGDRIATKILGGAQ